MQKVDHSAGGEVDYLAPPGRERIAVSRLDGAQPGVIFFGGLRSDMTTVKALRVEAICRDLGRSCTRFDYSGHGLSSGRFEDGTISRWLADAEMVVEQAPGSRHVFVGSSLGGWLALLLAVKRPYLVASILGISAAVDFTEYVHDCLFLDEQREQLATRGLVEIPDCRGGSPFAIAKDLIEDGRKHLLLKQNLIPIECPIRLINARNDRDIPWDTGLKLAEKLQTNDVQVTIIKDGAHQLDRPSDLKVLKSTLVCLLSQTS